MPEPLSGITVIEMTVAIQGPAAALYLRDMGAEVIKVEPPLGDPSRYMRGRQNELPENSMAPQHVAVNRGKRSICLDIKTDLGSRALFALLDNADVFLTNFRAAALTQMGLGYEQLKEKYPQLIYASVNGFGPKGPDASKAMFDGAACARGGLTYHTGNPDREPAMPGAIIIDTAGAMQLALGVMTAICARERHGVSQQVQTSALGATLWLQQWEITHVAMTNAELTRDGNHHSNIGGIYGVYETKDGDWITLAQVMAQEAWDALCIFAETWELAIHPSFQTPGQRLGDGISEEATLEVREILKTAFASKTTDEWLEFLYSEPEIVWEKARSWREVLVDEQNIANDYLTTVNLPDVGKTKTVGNLVALSETPGSVKGNPPELGEANNALLAELGFNSSELAEIEMTATQQREETIAELKAIADAAAQ